MNEFRFSAELIGLRSDVMAELSSRGFEWLCHYNAIDTMQDRYGLEVTGIQAEGDARVILRLLIEQFPKWSYRRVFLKDEGWEAGWTARIYRDPETLDKNDAWKDSP